MEFIHRDFHPEPVTKGPIMKNIITCFFLLLPFATTAFGANVTFPGKITEIRRETNSVTCSWSDLFLMVKVTGSGSSVWLRMADVMLLIGVILFLANTSA